MSAALLAGESHGEYFTDGIRDAYSYMRIR
jgi:hypothetical protein